MHLELRRRWFTERSTIGELYTDGEFECFALEDVVREDPNPSTPENEAKVPGRTAIPCGLYRVAITQSYRFRRPMPELLKVPGYSGVRIHSGNTDEDTEGCILVGLQRFQDRIGLSRAAFSVLFGKLEAVARIPGSTITIEILNDRVTQ